MAFTRDNTDRMQMNVDQAYNSANYMLNVPGIGDRPDFIVDPQIRLQQFGANISANVVDINSSLLGVNRQLDRDQSVKNTRDPNFNDTYKKYTFPSIKTAITDQPRAINPAWQVRDLEQNNWAYLHSNPQQNTEATFANNISSRMVEKDEYLLNCK
jgi:hypothetical protein